MIDSLNDEAIICSLGLLVTNLYLLFEPIYLESFGHNYAVTGNP